MDNFNLSEHFSQYFNICVANTPQLKEEVFKIRYQVYCEELGYEPLDKFPDQMEKDAYDPHSIHCILQHKSTGIYAGCVRLVLSDPNNPEAKFPFENVSTNHLINFNELPRAQFGEVSRLAVLGQFRKREGEEKTPGGLIMFDEKKKEKEQQPTQRRFPVIALSLNLAFLSLLDMYQIDYAIALMEPRLARHVRIMGLTFLPMGEVVEFHGKRGPFVLKTSEVVKNLPDHKPDVYELFRLIQNHFEGKVSYNFRIA